MLNPLANAIDQVHLSLCPPGSREVLCRAQGISVQLRPDGKARYLNCSVEIDCRFKMKSGCAKLEHEVMATSPAVQSTTGNSGSTSDDFIYE